MATDSQKSVKDLEPQDQNLIKEFTGIVKRDALELYERAHQKQIMEASIYVRDAFDKHWKSVTGNFYFSPITLRAKSDGPEPGTLHPKSIKYRVRRTFSKIRWKKNLNEIPIRSGETRKIISFDTFGTMENGVEVAIERNVEPNALIAIVGETLTQQIVKAGKTNFDGTIELSPPQDITIIGYWEVIFSPKSAEQDPEDVTLTHNGNCLQIKRNEKVVLPGYYLEIADNGTYPRYIQTPEQSRKVVGWVQFFPYTVLREASESEYLKQKKEGDRLTAEARRRETELT
jgi:hypothetical protein